MRAAVRLVWTLSVRHLTTHRLRLALSAVGVASGVSLAIGVSSLGSSLEASLEDTARAAASRANVELRPAAGRGLSRELVGAARSLDGVRAAGAAVESFTEIRHEGAQVRALVLGIDPGMADLAPRAVDPDTLDPTGPGDWEDPVLGSGPFDLERLYAEDAPIAGPPPSPFGLVLTQSLADALGAAPGSQLQVATPTGWRSIGVTGVAPATPDEQAVAAGMLATVQELMARDGLVDVIYVDAADPGAFTAQARAAMGDVARIGPVAFRESEMGQLMSGATLLVGLAGVVALFVGAFLVYNTMSMAAVERSGEAALLRAVGGRRRQVFALHMAEGGAIGIVGASVGVLGGVLVARLMLTSQGAGVQEISPVQITELALRSRDVAVAWLAGVAAALGASYLPARRIARADPVQGLGPIGTLEEPDGAGPRHVTVAAGAALIAIGAAAISYMISTGRADRLFIGLAVALTGVALLLRPGIPALAGLLLRPLSGDRSHASGVVRLAAGEVLRSPGRTAFTVGAVLLALSVVVGVSLGTSSFRESFRLSFDEILRADLYVRSETWRPFGSDVPLDAGLVNELNAVEDVAFAYPFRLATTAYEGQAVIIVAFDFEAYARLPGLSEASRTQADRQAGLLSEPGAALATPSMKTQLGIGVGDDIMLPSHDGRVTLRIKDVMEDPSAFTPTIYMDTAELARLWGTDEADVFQVALAAGADPERVKARIIETLGPGYQLEVDTREEYVERVNALVGSVLDVVSSLLVVVVVTAGLGLANTLIISTMERRRDLGVLRAVGMQRRQVRRMVAAEAVMVGGIGVAVAFVLGTCLGYLFTLGSQAQIGVPVPFRLHAGAYVQAAALGIAGAVAACAYPAWRAARVNVVEALQYE